MTWMTYTFNVTCLHCLYIVKQKRTITPTAVTQRTVSNHRQPAKSQKKKQFIITARGWQSLLSSFVVIKTFPLALSIYALARMVSYKMLLKKSYSGQGLLDEKYRYSLYHENRLDVAGHWDGLASLINGQQNCSKSQSTDLGIHNLNLWFVCFFSFNYDHGENGSKSLWNKFLLYNGCYFHLTVYITAVHCLICCALFLAFVSILESKALVFLCFF